MSYWNRVHGVEDRSNERGEPGVVIKNLKGEDVEFVQGTFESLDSPATLAGIRKASTTLADDAEIVDSQTIASLKSEGRVVRYSAGREIYNSELGNDAPPPFIIEVSMAYASEQDIVRTLRDHKVDVIREITQGDVGFGTIKESGGLNQSDSNYVLLGVGSSEVSVIKIHSIDGSPPTQGDLSQLIEQSREMGMSRMAPPPNRSSSPSM